MTAPPNHEAPNGQFENNSQAQVTYRNITEVFYLENRFRME